MPDSNHEAERLSRSPFVPRRPGRPARPRAGPVVHIEIVPGKSGGPSFARHSYAPLLRLAHDSE